jgi:hypothetical protein
VAKPVLSLPADGRAALVCLCSINKKLKGSEELEDAWVRGDVEA